MAALETALVERARQPLSQGPHPLLLSHPSELLRELYRRYRTPTGLPASAERSARAGLAIRGPRELEQEEGHWTEVLAWTEEGLWPSFRPRAAIGMHSRRRAVRR